MDDLSFPIQENEAIRHIRDPLTIRQRCHHILNWVKEDKSPYFKYNAKQLDKVAEYVSAETLRNYPKLNVPFHARRQHFFVDGTNRVSNLKTKLSHLNPKEFARVEFELTIISVLLDAGAGPTWQYKEPNSGKVFARSEGLAVASFDLFCSGALSSDPNNKFQVDSQGLANLDLESFNECFQILSAPRVA